MGRLGESRVRTLLEGSGFEIHKINWRTPFGEVDLVARQGDTLLIGEVKTRSGQVTDPLKCLSRRQLDRLKRAATWIWVHNRGDFKKFQSGLFIVTSSGISWRKLPLLYDQA